MNHGPDEKGPEGRRHGPAGPEADRLGAESGGFGTDEPALRRLLHSAVDDIEPRVGSLDHLRRAVPARRARKRQAAVGMAAAALFIGTAIPALVHVSHSSGTDYNTAMAGQSSQAQGGTGQSKDKGGGDTDPRKGAGSASAQPGKEPGKPGETSKPGGTTTGSTGGANPSATLTAGGVPPCTAAQLGAATGTADVPDSAGVVYGTFRVVNTSAAACTVAGAGTVTPTAVGAADQAKISVTRHVAGDAATDLPDPSLEVTGLLLQPGAAYEEKFAFVPSQTCPTTGGDSTTGGTDPGQPSPDPSPTQDASASGGSADSGGSAGSAGTTTQLMTGNGTADGSVQITHTAQGGSPSATATVTGQCAGTVIYTGVLAGS
ncbi:hypothetical protein [Streptomyces sp. NPDC007205]|uniref:hypothetical protein n=1 Tax=Streptomyces sp. NPDC007205 TaxID=3154316 RepID=UPI0033CCF2D0